jgi:REP element-mobilizing transposase RayT
LTHSSHEKKKTTYSPQSKNLRKGRISSPGQYYSLTKNSIHMGTRILMEGTTPLVLVDRIFLAQQRSWWDILAFVIMPVHYHLVAKLGDMKGLGAVLGIVNRAVSRKVMKGSGISKLWQDGFYDRQVRPHEDLSEYVNYIHQNPVRKGLVESMKEWPFSSAHPEYSERVKWD